MEFDSSEKTIETDIFIKNIICNISFTTRIKLKKQYNWVRKIVETNQSSAASCYVGPVVHQLTDRSGDSYRDWFWQDQGAHERRHPPVNRPFADR